MTASSTGVTPGLIRTLSPIDGVLALFALSALAGAMIAADSAAAWRKFGLIIGGVAVYYALVYLPTAIDSALGKRRARGALGGTIADEASSLRWVLAALPAALAAYLLATAGWVAWREEQLTIPPYAIHPNAVGGMIAGLLPLQLAALSDARTPRRLALAGMLLGTAGLGLLASATRGAWLALALALSGWGWQRLLGGRARWAVALTAEIALLAIVALATPLGGHFVEGLGGRPALWRNSFDLGRDYLFSGLGLAGFEMAYSSYALLVHVGFLTHAHNLFLDIWLEQGILGVVAWIGLLGVAVRLASRQNAWRGPVLVALATIVLHGLVDDSFYGYDGRGALLLFAPLAVLVRGARLVDSGKAPKLGRPVGRALGAFGLAFVFAVLLSPAARAAAQANLGAVLQTRAELAVYRWPTWPLQDAVRRSPQVDLAPALARYTAALALDPDNVTANRRLGQIELARGEEAAARQHLEAAYATAPEQRATRQLLGESYALAGDVQRAAALWRTIDVSQQQLELRQWWYNHLGEEERAQWIQQAARQAAANSEDGSN